jgi:hypothetical protein
VVRHAAQARVLIAGVVLAAGLGACGGSSGAAATATSGTAPATASGNPDLGELRMVNCQDWRRGDETARKGSVRELRDFASGPVGSPAGNGAQLPDGVAYRFFERYCAHDYATYFKLYKLYTRAAAFTPQQ